MLSPEIKTRINQLWDKFWSNGISARFQVIEQISYLIYIRWLEDTEKVPLTFRWSYLREMVDKEERLEHVANEVFPWLKTLWPDEYPFSRQMATASFLIPNSLLLDEAILLLDKIAEETRTQQSGDPALQDTLGDVYTYLLHDISAGSTDVPPAIPGHIADFIGELGQPSLGERICDPCCGTGDFLVAAGQCILRDQARRGERFTEEQRALFEQKTFVGCELDPVLLRLATMNLMVHGVDQPLMVADPANVPDWVGTYKLVLSCPTNMEHDNVLKSIVSLLAPGGRAVLLVSETVLADKKYQALRKSWLETCEIQALVRLPVAPEPIYFPGKNSILVFRKRRMSEVHAKLDPVWMCELTTDGFDYLSDGQRVKQPGENPLPAIAAAFHARNSDHPSAVPTAGVIRVSPTTIIDNDYSLDLKVYQSTTGIGDLGFGDSGLFKGLTSFMESKAGAAIASAVGKFVKAKAPAVAKSLQNLVEALTGGELTKPVSVTEQFIRENFRNDPFTFRELHTARLGSDVSVTFEMLHREVWSLLNADQPVLRQVYYDARLVNYYPEAYQFLKNRKADNGIYLLFTQPITIETHETSLF
ncbi:MAG TPA: N-6 DNA methylase [Puia sp.]|jgi:type I restriction enzyme M protein|nr:N-6 DNA methylase [Puia sp.]